MTSGYLGALPGHWRLEDWLQQVELLLRTLPGSLQPEVVIAQCSLPGAGQQCRSCVEIPPESWSQTVRGRLAVHSIDSFLQSWGWPLGKHSAVYNSAYVHCSWGLWVSQKGCALRLCPKRLAESQLYGNGRKGGGGSLLPDLMLKIQEARLLLNPLNPDLTGSLRSDTEARLRPPGPASLALCQPAPRRHR